MELPQGWHINAGHVTACNRHGINARELAKIFKAWAKGRRRSNWDQIFAGLIRAIGEHEFDPDRLHKDMVGYGDVEDWWERGSGSRIWL